MVIFYFVSECKSMQVHLVLWAVLTALTGDGYISALSNEVTRIPKIRHKSFSFNNDEDEDSESDAVEENKDIEKKIKIPQLPKAQPSRSKGKPKSILEKLVREPELGKNSSMNWNIGELFVCSDFQKPCRQSIKNSIQSQMDCQKDCIFIVFGSGTRDCEIELATFSASPSWCQSQSAWSQ